MVFLIHIELRCTVNHTSKLLWVMRLRVAGFQLKPSSASGRLLMVTTLLFSLLLYNSYSAVLMASLAVTNRALPFSNLDEVAKKGTHALCVRNLSYAYMRLKVSVTRFLYGPGCRSKWPRGLRRSSAAARLLRFWVRSHRGHGCLSVVSVVCCQIEVSCLCDGLITRPEESY